MDCTLGSGGVRDMGLIGLLVMVVFLTGCALAPIIIGLAVDTTASGIGIYQRQQHQEALDRQAEELKSLRVEVADRQMEELRNLRLEVMRLRGLPPGWWPPPSYQIYRIGERNAL
jgi:hypothetical protein